MKNELTNRMILVEDLIDKMKGRLLDRLVKCQDKIFKEIPHHCSSCYSKSIVGVEILGAKDGVLLWECEDCYEMFLKYGADETEVELQYAKECWTVPKSWGHVPRRKYN